MVFAYFDVILHDIAFQKYIFLKLLKTFLFNSKITWSSR